MTRSVYMFSLLAVAMLLMSGKGLKSCDFSYRIMPRVEDYALMGWAEEFPSHTPSAPWQRCILTGRYAMVLDTQTMRVPRFGPVPPGVDYETRARADNHLWQSLPPADLTLTITANGKVHRCTAGGGWSNFRGPRLIESGRFMQRADVTDLVFTAEDGSRLDVEARFETVAWPDRLSLVLIARPREPWPDASMDIRLRTGDTVFERRRDLPATDEANASDWHEVAVSITFPASGKPTTAEATSPVTVEASEISTGTACKVDHDAVRGWHRVNLDDIVPIDPPDGHESDRRANDVVERVRLVLTNPDATERIARLLFEKNGPGFHSRLGASITGMSAVLRDVDGNPTGIPVQLSKNWHLRPEGGVHSGTWFHGFTQVRLPPGAKIELELTIAYGHWGGVAAASHAQLCLIGWGSNQLWEESALGSWGESICYEPDQAQGRCAILDVRPLMVRSTNHGNRWQWTHNVGGGDYFRLFDVVGNRVFPGRMRAVYKRHGPCLTEVTYAGRTGNALEHSATVSLGRTDDIVRGVYRLRLDVTEPLDFSRFVLFQIGADTYSPTGERKMAVGNETGLTTEWNTQWGDDTYRTEPIECTGREPWISLHEAVSRAEEGGGAWANRGVVIRSWDARLGGRPAVAWVAERGVRARGKDTSTIDLVPPPGITRFEPGDFVEATLVYVVMPQFAEDYYGPNQGLLEALSQWENTWRMIHREAVGNQRRVEMKLGTLEHRYPAVRVQAIDDQAEYTITGGLGHVPLTFVGLTSRAGGVLYLDGQRVDQSTHGNDFWQTDYDPTTQRWEVTYTIPLDGKRPRTVRFE